MGGHRQPQHERRHLSALHTRRGIPHRDGHRTRRRRRRHNSGYVVSRGFDIALKGALLATLAPEGLRLQEQCRLVLSLTYDGDSITMDGSIAHLDGSKVGLQCLEIDISNMTRLRRLLELNTGDVDLVDRELSQLIRRTVR